MSGLEGIEYLEETRAGAAPVSLAEAVAEAVAEVIVEGLPTDLAAAPTALPLATEPGVEVAAGNEDGADPSSPLKRLRRIAFKREPADEVMDRQAARTGRARVTSYSSLGPRRRRCRPRPHLSEGDRQGPLAHRRARGGAGHAHRGRQ